MAEIEKSAQLNGYKYRSVSVKIKRSTKFYLFVGRRRINQSCKFVGHCTAETGTGIAKVWKVAPTILTLSRSARDDGTRYLNAKIASGEWRLTTDDGGGPATKSKRRFPPPAPPPTTAVRAATVALQTAASKISKFYDWLMTRCEQWTL